MKKKQFKPNLPGHASKKDQLTNHPPVEKTIEEEETSKVRSKEEMDEKFFLGGDDQHDGKKNKHD